MFKTKDGIKDFYEDPNFYMVYARAIAKYEGFKEREFYEKKLVDFKGTKYEQFVKKAVEYMK